MAVGAPVAAESSSKLRTVLSSLVFLVVVLSSATAGWALIERSETTGPNNVRAQVEAVAPERADGRAAVDVPAIEDAVPVLAYGPVDETDGHGAIDPATFASHLSALDDAGFESVSVADVTALAQGRRPELPEHPVLITVDGTHRSAWTTIDPLLAVHGFEAVAFVDPALVVDHASSVRLTWDEVEALDANGRWTIGLGAQDVLTADDDGSPAALRAQLEAEFDQKMDSLDERTGRRATAVAYKASGPHATEASFQAGRAADDGADLVFTESRTEMLTADWPSTSAPRIPTEDVTARDLIGRIASTVPRTPDGLDAPPDPTAPPVVVSLSWDDGRASTYRSVAIQQRHGFDATYFINSDQIGTSRYYLSRGQLDEIERAGNEIGGHTQGHVDLAAVSRTRARSVICDDRKTLVDWYGPSAGATFAYPFGSNPNLEDQVAECGYSAGRITSGLQGPLGCVECPAVESLPPVNRFAIATSGSVRVDWTLADLQSLVLQAEASGGGWVNYVLHAISSAPDDDYAITTETYDALLSWLEERPNVTVKTIGEVMAESETDVSGS